jgi:acyl-CoA reductase-like NAD-dependent aldehyde dehydrogenase
VTLELGGKSPNIVFADADLEAAAAAAAGAVFGNAGQDCCARSRILVQRPAMEEFLGHLERAVTTMRVGDPLDADTEMGPLISEAHRRPHRAVPGRPGRPRRARGDLRARGGGDRIRRRGGGSSLGQ